MNYGIYAFYRHPPGGAYEAAPAPLTTQRPSPAEEPTLVQSILSLLSSWVSEGLAILRRIWVWGIETLQRFLAAVGYLPTLPAPVPTPVVLQQPGQPAPTWSGSDWDAYWRASASATASSPTPSAAESASCGPADTVRPGSSGGNADRPASEGHAAPTTVEEPPMRLEQARAWFQATTPLRDPDAAIDDMCWEEIAAPEVQHILTVAVTTRVGPDRAASPGCERDALGPWLDRVARVAHRDPVERLGWMATLAPALARRGITENHRRELLGAAAGRLEEVDRRKPSAVRGALQAVERLATSELDPAGTLVETVTARWGGCAWPEMPAGDARALLRTFVKGMAAALVRRDGSRARMFAHLLLTLAPSGYALAAERLVWFAQAVASPIGAAALDGSAVRDALTAGVGRWFDELPRGSPCGAAEVVLEWWASPLGACMHEEPVARWLAAALPDPDDRLAALPEGGRSS